MKNKNTKNNKNAKNAKNSKKINKNIKLINRIKKIAKKASSIAITGTGLYNALEFVLTSKDTMELIQSISNYIN